MKVLMTGGTPTMTVRRPSVSWQDKPCDIRPYRRHPRSFEKVLGPRNGMWFLHHCNNKTCWEPTHIYRGTRSDNVKDAYAAGVSTSPSLRPEVAAKIGDKLRGRTYPEERNKKISKTLTGKPKSEEHRAALRRAWEKRKQHSASAHERSHADSSRVDKNTNTFLVHPAGAAPIAGCPRS